MEFKHVPIMLKECIDGLNIKPDGIYVDGTLGGGGHSKEIVKKLTSGKLIGIDKDVTAINVCKNRFEQYKNNVIFVNDDFKNFAEIMQNLQFQTVDGVLLDLGVSSYQLDQPERGFSFRFDAPLDMRMNQSQTLSAYDVVNTYSQAELTKILFEYGEENFAKSIARNIVKQREISDIKTTAELVKIVENSVPKKLQFGGRNVATKTFQAIRIEVNGELKDLEKVLKQMVMHLSPKGRLAVITFHSLEDRIAKQTFNLLATDCLCDRRSPICVCNHKATIKIINKKPIIASEEEQKQNSRSTCAKLRIVEKL